MKAWMSGLAMAVLVGSAASAVPDAGRVSLTPEARAAAIEAAADGRGDDVDADAPRRRIHGEMGIEVGSRGGRALYGTTIVPLGDSATAGFSFLTSQGGDWRRR